MSVVFNGNALFFRPGPGGPDRDGYIGQGRVFGGFPGGTEAGLMADLARNPCLMGDLETDLCLAYYQADADRLVLIRDACGLGPLFYAPSDGGWAVAFDLGDLFRLLGGPPPMDEDTFFDFVGTHYRYIFRDPGRTFHRGVRQVPAGCSLSLSAGGPRETRWLDLGFQPEVPAMDPGEASRRYVSLLEENVILRLEALAGQDYAFSISSGLDSSSVAALAARHLGRPLDCWFMAYRDQSGSPFDETGGVMDLIEATGWRLNRVDLGAPDLLAETRALMDLTLAPMATVTWLAHHVLAKKAAQAGCRFLFSGLGGDESLAGEFEHFFAFFADLRAAGQEDVLERETVAWARLHDHPVFRKSPAVRDDWLARNVDFAARTIRVDQARYLAVREYFDQDWWTSMEARQPPVPLPHPYPFFLSNRLFQEMSSETSVPTLWSESLSSRAAGLRGIFPMTSPRLIRLALSAPGTLKYEDGLTKMLLRRALSGILPDSSRLNPVKTGFNAPLDLWLREPGLAREVGGLLSSPPFSRLGWLAPGAAGRILAEHLDGRRNHMMLLWPLISTAIFLEKFGR